MEKLLLPTFTSEINGDAAWCVSFDLVWKDFVEEILKGDFTSQPCPLIDALTEESKKEIKLNDKEYLVKSGMMTTAFKKQLLKALKKKFKKNGYSSFKKTIESLEFASEKETDRILIYSAISFASIFRKKFDKINEDKKFARSEKPVKFWGTGNHKLLDDVAPLFHNDDNDFALAIHTKDNKSIVLYRTDENKNFDSTLETIKQKSQNIDSSLVIDCFMVPELNLDTTAIFDELIGKTLTRVADNTPFRIGNAMQNLKLTLNNEGAVVKSEARLELFKGAIYQPKEYRNFIFDDTFYLYILDHDTPIVALRVENIDKFTSDLD